MRVPPVCSDPGGSHPVGCGAPAPARPTASGNTDRGRHGPAATPALPTELGGVDACAQNGSLPERAPLTVAGHSQGRDGWGLPTDLQEQWGADGHMWVWFHTQSSRPSMRQHAEKKREREIVSVRSRTKATRQDTVRRGTPWGRPPFTPFRQHNNAAPPAGRRSRVRQLAPPPPPRGVPSTSCGVSTPPPRWPPAGQLVPAPVAPGGAPRCAVGIPPWRGGPP